MEYTGDKTGIIGTELIPFDKKYAEQYLRIYNECYYDLRKALDIKPYNYYSDTSQIEEELVYLLMDGETIIGSATINGCSIDDVIVNKPYQRRGYGRRLLLWAIDHIKEYSTEPIRLNAAEWNKRAVDLYSKNGFVITKTREIRRKNGFTST